MKSSRNNVLYIMQLAIRSMYCVMKIVPTFPMYYNRDKTCFSICDSAIINTLFTLITKCLYTDERMY